MQDRIKDTSAFIVSLVFFIALSVLSVRCTSKDVFSPQKSQLCGTGLSSSELNGLFWLMGSPTTGNVLCSSGPSGTQVVQVLEPVSRDPILLQDQQSGHILLIERFSGPVARPSRASLFESNGALISQRGDWPQNTYSVIRTSATDGLVTGFDFAELRDFSWSTSGTSLFGDFGRLAKSVRKTNPVFSLKNAQWIALVDGGYDLQTYKAIDSQAHLFETKSPTTELPQVLVRDVASGQTCKNLFQFIVLSHSTAVISCNPQYFGAAENEELNVFFIELTAEGTLNVRTLLSKSAVEVQRIDLWGVDFENAKVFVGLKSTTLDDYQGKLIAAGWLNLASGQWAPESRFAGPSFALPGGKFISYCQHESASCREGDFIMSRSDSMDVQLIRPDFSLPFLSFPSRVAAP